MQYTELQYKTIDFLRFPVMVGVVFVHSFGPPADIAGIEFSTLTSTDFYDLIRVIFSKFLGTVASPFFFLVSGYLFFYRIEELNREVYLSKIGNRLMTLVIPYIAWNLIAFFAPILTAFLKAESQDALAMLRSFNLDIFWGHTKYSLLVNENFFGQSIVLSGPINTPLWFLRDLIILSIFTPLINWYIRKTKIFGIIFIGLLFVTRSWLPLQAPNSLSVFFYSLGAFWGINKKDLLVEIRKTRWFAPILTLVLLVLNILYYGSQIQAIVFFSLFKVFVLFSVIDLTGSLIKRGYLRSNEHLSGASFFLYVAHTVTILGVTEKFYSGLIQSESTIMLLIKYLAVPITVVVICVLLYLIFKKTIPKVFNLLTGSR